MKEVIKSNLVTINVKRNKRQALGILKNFLGYDSLDDVIGFLLLNQKLDGNQNFDEELYQLIKKILEERGN